MNFSYSLLGQSQDQHCHSCGQTVGPEKSNAVWTGLQCWGHEECHISFFFLSQRKGSQFSSMCGGFLLTLLFKETFGEYVLQDSAKPFSCIHYLIPKPCHEMGIIIFIYGTTKTERVSGTYPGLHQDLKGSVSPPQTDYSIP